MTMCMSIMRQLGMKEENILKAVTLNAAKAISLEKYCGKIEVGRTADIAVLKYCNSSYDFSGLTNNAVKNEKGYVNMMTVADGQIVYLYE